jgi:hypothetical protein
VPEIVPVPMLLPPLKKVTVPLAPLVTVAVKVTDPPYIEGVPEVATEMVEADAVTVTLAVPLSVV